MIEHKTLDAFEVVGAKRDVRAHLCRAGIARRDVKVVDLGALRDFPCQCVFATAGSEKKKVCHIVRGNEVFVEKAGCAPVKAGEWRRSAPGR